MLFIRRFSLNLVLSNSHSQFYQSTKSAIKSKSEDYWLNLSLSRHVMNEAELVKLSISV